MSRLTLLAPLAGWAAPLAEVPDPVFAARMMGEGLAIDPTEGLLTAPCAATVIKVHGARHAVTLLAENGAEILLHVGLDTVALGGEGFEALITNGQSVASGDPLLRFDLDVIARRARSLLTPVLVTNPDAFDVSIVANGREVVRGEPIVQLTPKAQGAIPNPAGGARASRRIRITHVHGLHARPAARIASEAKHWAASVEVALADRRAEARSPVALMTLGVAAGDEIEIIAAGPDAEAALAALAAVLDQINAEPPARVAPSAPAAPQTAAPLGVIAGVAAAPGLASGPAWPLRAAEAPVADTGASPEAERIALDAALAAARTALTERLPRLAGEAHQVVTAHLALLEDPGLVEPARRGVAAGASAGAAWRDATDAQRRALQATGDPRLAERALDLKDLRERVLWALAGREPARPAPPAGAILLADDLLPSELAGLEDAGVAGLCTARGGPTSHVAVLAAALGIPAVVAAGAQVMRVTEGVTVVLDGEAGRLETAPSPARLSEVRAQIAVRAERDAAVLAAVSEPARTADGGRIEVFANVGSLADAQAAARNGAEGCGLLRTEFLFLDRATPPSEDEQADAYRAVLEALAGRPVIVRTLDVGGDKPAPYMDLPAEENPALGVRGVRISLRQPELLKTQLRAILRADTERAARIMIPMVASIAEVEAVRAVLVEVAAELGCPPPPLGVMIETPAAAATADLLARHADFVSIGTNDLAQYALAMDRTAPALAAEVDALHPAVLRLMRLAAEGASAAGKPVGVCGSLASDATGVPFLLGLGVTELSVTPARVAATKAEVRMLDLSACRDLAARACDQVSAADVRALKPAPRARRARKGAPA